MASSGALLTVAFPWTVIVFTAVTAPPIVTSSPKDPPHPLTSSERANSPTNTTHTANIGRPRSRMFLKLPTSFPFLGPLLIVAFTAHAGTRRVTIPVPG